MFFLFYRRSHGRGPSAFGRRALNEGQEIHNVSLVMGHSSVATTQGEYCDKDLHEASRDIQGVESPEQ